MDEGNFESLFIDIELGNEKITCGIVYRSPKQDKSSNKRFRLKLRGVLNAIKASKNNAYIMGDFNYDLLQHLMPSQMISLIPCMIILFIQS